MTRYSTTCLGLIVGTAIALGSPAQAQLERDDIGPDGLKQRGNGSVDDSQPGIARPQAPRPPRGEILQFGLFLFLRALLRD